MNPEHKKLIVVVVVLAVAGGIYLYFGRTYSALPGSVKFVCVATGKTFRVAQADIPSILPGRNPDTNQMTLLPILEKDGKLFADSRYARDLLRDPELAKVNKYVDPKTLEILKSPR